MSLPRPPHRLLILAALVALGACGWRPGPAAHRPPPRFGEFVAPDTGAHLLAAVENARQAIAGSDRDAALNDVGQALSDADHLPDNASRLFEDEPVSTSPGAASPNGRTDFDVQVELTDAQTQLQTGDLAKADADLAAIENGVPASLVPADLPLLRAAQGLAMARQADSGGQPAELRTQLEIARDALAAYPAGPHAAEVRPIAAAIARLLGPSGRLQQVQSAQLAVWSDQIDAAA